MVNKWAYGFVEEEIDGEKCLTLCEIFLENEKIVSCSFVGWDEIDSETIKYIISDIKSQIKKDKLIIVKNGRLEWKRKKTK